jgi:hypothetical protein
MLLGLRLVARIRRCRGFALTVFLDRFMTGVSGERAEAHGR